jgi:hypothetical protein
MAELGADFYAGEADVGHDQLMSDGERLSKRQRSSQRKRQ